MCRCPHIAEKGERIIVGERVSDVAEAFDALCGHGIEESTEPLIHKNSTPLNSSLEMQLHLVMMNLNL
ncbi:hypothetical protein CY35_16G076600 [Sphagnum magellanicum]|nr:hypothetical protein CY35_16G076600 [Sphagnum magellanicum]